MDCFFGDINGHNIYDGEPEFGEEPNNFGYGGSHNFLYVNLVGRKIVEANKAILFDLLNHQKDMKGFAGQKWLPKKHIKLSPVNKITMKWREKFPDYIKEYVVISVPMWLYCKFRLDFKDLLEV